MRQSTDAVQRVQIYSLTRLTDNNNNNNNLDLYGRRPPSVSQDYGFAPGCIEHHI